VYLHIVESSRTGAGIRHRVLQSLGREEGSWSFREMRQQLRGWRPMRYASAALLDVGDKESPIPEIYKRKLFRLRPGG